MKKSSIWRLASNWTHVAEKKICTITNLLWVLLLSKSSSSDFIHAIQLLYHAWKYYSK
jgi:hypothetical protein